MKFHDNIKGILPAFLFMVIVFGAIASTGCSNVRIVYPAERYDELMADLPDHCKPVEYDKADLKRCYIQLNPSGIHVMHVVKGEAQCLEHELWHCENPLKTHKDMPDYLKREWKTGG